MKLRISVLNWITKNKEWLIQIGFETLLKIIIDRFLS